MSEKKSINLEDATFDQLKLHAVQVMGLEVAPAMSKASTLMAKMKAAKDDLTHIDVAVDAKAAKAEADKEQAEADDAAEKLKEAEATAKKEADEAEAAKKVEEEAAEAEALKKAEADKAKEAEVVAAKKAEADAKAKPAAPEWVRMTDENDEFLDMEVNTRTGKTRAMVLDEIEEGDDGQELVWITIHPTDDDAAEEPITILVNGRAILVPKGEIVPIKRMYLDVLNNAIKTGYHYNPKTNETKARDSHSVPFTLFGTVEALGDDHGGEQGLIYLKAIRGK